MSEPLDEAALEKILPGAWVVAASNLPMWLAGGRTRPRITFELVGSDPLVITEEVRYLDVDGDSKRVAGRATWQRGEFLQRGTGLRKFIGSRWAVPGANDDRSVISIRSAASLGSPDGLEIAARVGADHPELRAMVARNTEQFGLSPEEFASLSWLPTVPTD